MAKTPSLHDQLLEAAGGRGTDADLRALIARGADVKGRAGAGPLNWAVAAGRLSTVQLLLDTGASIDGDHPKHTPLMQAKSAEVARYLLERGARTDGREALRGDALDFTIDRADDTEHACVLLDHGFRIESRHLISAVKKARTRIVRLLLDSGGDVDGLDRDGRSILATALAYREDATVLLLLERGARVSPDDLPIACERHNAPVVALVLGKTTGDVTSAAERAAERDHVELLRILIESDRVVRLGDVLRAAARRGAALAFDFLLHCGAVPRERDANGASALHAAARGGSIAILDRCLAEGCVFDLDAKGRTALHHAALGRTADMLRALAARGLDVEARDHDRCTPLATCASDLNTPMYDTLLELGADRSTGEAIREAKIAEDEAFIAQFR